MTRQQDPIRREAGDSHDLQEVATWEPRSRIDSLAVRLYRAGIATLRAIVVGLAFAILLTQFVLGGIGVVIDPIVGTLVFLSIVPALAIAAHLWYLDVTTREPLSLLLGTFVLAVLFAMFAAVINAIGIVPFSAGIAYLSAALPGLAGPVTFLGMGLFFFLIVGPIEEAVKLLAVRLHAFRSDQFDAVIDGTVYGAAAGLGFATIENALFIARGLEAAPVGVGVIGVASGVAVTRAVVGPGHVLFSAIAGFYLGLAKFNPEHAGPLVVKGLLIAAVFHALYNTLVGTVPQVVATIIDPVTVPIAFLGFVAIYLSAVGYFLYRKLEGYRRMYAAIGLS